MDESTPPVKKISSGPPVKLLHVQYKPHSQDATQDPDHLVLSDFDKTGFNDTATKDTRLSQHWLDLSFTAYIRVPVGNDTDVGDSVEHINRFTFISQEELTQN